MQEKGIFGIFNDISEHVTLVQWIGNVGNVNNEVTIAVCWINDSNYDISLSLMK